MSSKTILYILPHYDDEMFVIPKITSDIKAGYNVNFFYLMKSERRLKESIRFLKRLGILEANITSIGDKFDTSDGLIHLHINKIYSFLISSIKSADEIVTTAYEGGHNDHDTASLVSRALAEKYNAKVLEFFLYNGHRTSGKFYRVAYPINLSNKVTLPYMWWDIAAVILAPFIYLSQISAMIGLWPFLMLKILKGKPLTMNLLKSDFMNCLDHDHIPLYERWGRITQKELSSNNKDFLELIRNSRTL